MGMRSVLNLDVSLGLFGFPVKVYKGTNDPSEGVKFRQVHNECGTPLNEVKRCSKCDTDVPYSDVRKGYEVEPNNFLVFTEDEIKALKPQGSGVLKLDGYLDADTVDPAYFDGAVYYLSPAGKDPTTFVTFRDALGQRLAVGKVVMYGREHVVLIRSVERVLALHFVRPLSEIRNVNDMPGYDKIPDTASPDHIALMSQLMDKGAVALEDVTLEADAYVAAVKALVQSRLDGEPAPETPTVAAVPQATDLMAMLKASLAEKAAS